MELTDCRHISINPIDESCKSPKHVSFPFVAASEPLPLAPVRREFNTTIPSVKTWSTVYMSHRISNTKGLSNVSMPPSFLRIPLDIDSNHPKYLYLIFTGPPLNIYQIFMNIPLKLVAPRCFGSSGFRHFWVTLTRNCRKFCFQQDARPVCGARPSPSRDLCLYKLAIPIIICLWHNEQSG